MGILDVSKSI